jgi:GNAT superfamily N-acetyltransferase
VAQRHRGKGIGRALLAHVADQARRRGLRELIAVPDTRNIAAIKTLHAAGYDTMAAVRLTMDLAGTSSEGDEVDLHNLRFKS